MKKLVLFFTLILALNSCGPTYNLANEKASITSLAKGDFNNESYYKNLPKFLKDSIQKKKLYKSLDSIRYYMDSIFFKTEDVISHNVTINKSSSTRKIKGYYFKIIEYSKFLKIEKNKANNYLKDYKAYLNNEIIDYSDNNSNQLTTHITGNILAFCPTKSKKWQYLPYFDLYNERLFGLESAQKLIDLYFDDIFDNPKSKWDKESISIFKEIYEEDRNDYEQDGIDFNKFLKCRMKFQQKAEEKFKELIPDTYYNSAVFLEQSIKCKVHSKKLNK